MRRGGEERLCYLEVEVLVALLASGERGPAGIARWVSVQRARRVTRMTVMQAIRRLQAAGLVAQGEDRKYVATPAGLHALSKQLERLFRLGWWAEAAVFRHGTTGADPA